MKPNLKINGEKVVNIEPAALGIIVDKPKFKDFADISKRLESFANWPESSPIDKKSLVEAGLVYAGVGDTVRCYFCGGGFKNWEQGDVPMEEHAKWFPKCAHVLLTKGQGYVDMINRGDVSNNEESAGACGEVDNEVTRTCLVMGFPKERIDKAIKFHRLKYGGIDFGTVQICNVLLDLNSDSSENDDSSDENSSGTGDTKDTAEDLKLLLAENNQLKENIMCKICMDGKGDIVFLPCGHMAACSQCAPVLSSCPMCRGPIDGKVKTYYS